MRIGCLHKMAAGNFEKSYLFYYDSSLVDVTLHEWKNISSIYVESFD